MSKSSINQQTAYFLFPPAAAIAPQTYPHQAVTLAEGLRELGWRVPANVAAWRESETGESLFEIVSSERNVISGQDPGAGRDADLVVIDSGWRYGKCGPIPAWVVAPQRQFLAVGIDGDDLSSDGAWCGGPLERKLDLVLRAHGQRAFRYPPNVRPWAFGLSGRIMRAIDAAPPAEGPRQGLGWNFNHKAYAHTVRKRLERRWLPQIEPQLARHVRVDRTVDPPPADPGPFEKLMHLQTCGRHIESYYARLKRLAAVACFGGWHLPPVPQPESGRAFRYGCFAWRKLGWGGRVVGQWDSWRFWETLYAGAAAVMLDFDYFGFRLPVMPVANEHYVAVRPGLNDEAVLATLNDTDRLARIGAAGRAWATEHYTPVATARRLVARLEMQAR